MKMLIAALALFASVNAQASAGQQFREDIRNLAAANNLKVVDMVPIYDGRICKLNANEGMGIVLLQANNGSLYAVSDLSFFSSLGGDNEADSAVLVDISTCDTKSVKF